MPKFLLGLISFPFAFVLLSIVMIALIGYSIRKIVQVYNKIDEISGPIVGVKDKK